MSILTLLRKKSSWGPYSSSHQEIRSMGTWRGWSSTVWSRGKNFILTARPTHKLCCASTPLDVPITRKSQRPFVTFPPQVFHSTNVPPMSMVFHYREQMTSLRIWSFDGNAGALVTDTQCVQKLTINLPSYAFMFTQDIQPPFDGNFNHPSWLLIDTRSTLNSIRNHKLLRRVMPCSIIQ